MALVAFDSLDSVVNKVYELCIVNTNSLNSQSVYTIQGMYVVVIKLALFCDNSNFSENMCCSMYKMC